MNKALLVLVLSAVAVNSVLVQGDFLAQSGNRIVCYVPTYDNNWGTGLLGQVPSTCTHVIMAFAMSTGGNLDVSGIPVTQAEQAAAAQLQSQGKKVTVSIGGYTAGNDWFDITDYQGYAAQVVKFLKSWSYNGSAGLDGVDLDYEPSPVKNQPAIDIINALSSAFAAESHSYIISFAGYGSSANPNDSDNYIGNVVQTVGDKVAFWSEMAYESDYQTWANYWAKMVGAENTMVGLCDDHPDCSAWFADATNSKDVANYVKNNGFGGVMIWNDNLDKSSSPNDGYYVLQTACQTICEIITC